MSNRKLSDNPVGQAAPSAPSDGAVPAEASKHPAEASKHPAEASKHPAEKGAIPARRPLPVGATALAEIVDRAYAIFANRLARHASENDGRILGRDLRAIMSKINPEDDAELRRTVLEGWQEVASVTERNFWMNKRTHPLERLLVRKFEHLLAPQGRPAQQGRTLSRRVVPAFITMMQQIVGEEVFGEYEQRSQTIVDNKRAKYGEAFTWDSVYEDDAGETLVNDILVYIARYFDDVEHRRRWMIDVFSRHLPPASLPDEVSWVFGPIEFHLLVFALYTDLTMALRDSDRTVALNHRYGPENLQILRHMMDALNRDKRAVAAAADPV